MKSIAQTTTNRNAETDFVEATTPLDNVSADKAWKLIEAQQAKRDKAMAMALAVETW